MTSHTSLSAFVHLREPQSRLLRLIFPFMYDGLICALWRDFNIKNAVSWAKLSGCRCNHPFHRVFYSWGETAEFRLSTHLKGLLFGLQALNDATKEEEEICTLRRRVLTNNTRSNVKWNCPHVFVKAICLQQFRVTYGWMHTYTLLLLSVMNSVSPLRA